MVELWEIYHVSNTASYNTILNLLFPIHRSPLIPTPDTPRPSQNPFRNSDNSVAFCRQKTAFFVHLNHRLRVHAPHVHRVGPSGLPPRHPVGPCPNPSSAAALETVFTPLIRKIASSSTYLQAPIFKATRSMRCSGITTNKICDSPWNYRN